MEQEFSPDWSREVERLLDSGRDGASALVDVVADEGAQTSEREAAMMLLASFRRVDPDLLRRVSAALGTTDWRVGDVIADLLPRLEPFPLEEVRQQLAADRSHRTHTLAARCLRVRDAAAAGAVPDLVRALRRESMLPPDDGRVDIDLGGRIGHPEEQHLVAAVSVEICQRAIIEALFRAGGESRDAIDALIECASTSPVVRDAACAALGRTAAGCSALCDLAASGAEFAVRRSALEALAGSASAPRDCAARLIACAERDEPDGELDCREAALRALARIPVPGEDAVEAFRRALSSPSPTIRATAAQSAGLSDPVAGALAAEIERGLDDPDARVVAGALSALRSSDPGIVVRVAEHLGSTSVEVQSAAAIGFARVAGREELLRELDAPRSIPCRALYLRALLRFPDQAADSLERVAHLHESWDPEVVDALLELARRSGAACLPQFVAFASRLLNAADRIRAIDHVVGAGGDQTATLLQPFLRYRHPAVRGAALRALLRTQHPGKAEPNRFVEDAIREAGGPTTPEVAVAVVSARPDIAAGMLTRGELAPQALLEAGAPLPDSVEIDIAGFVGSHAARFRAIRGLIRFTWRADPRAPAVEQARDAALRELARDGD